MLHVAPMTDAPMRVTFYKCIVLAHKTPHVLLQGEDEFLFSAYSAFRVDRVHWSPTPRDKQRPHEITLYALPDNKETSEDLPLAPWY